MDAIEHEFVPLFVRNNEPGRAAELLARYHEPAWNNPVVRFFAADGRELVERADDVQGADALARRCVAALDAGGRAVTEYLALALEELAPDPLERLVLAMPCFWHGESALGAIPGVRSTQAGFLEGREVVEVEFAPARLSLAALLRRAGAQGCAARAWVEPGPRLAEARAEIGAAATALVTRPRPAGGDDHEHALARSPLALLPLTPLQRVRANADLAAGREPDGLLSPPQRAWLAEARKHPERLHGLDPLPTRDPWARRAELERRLRNAASR